MSAQLEMLDQAEVHFRNHRFVEGADLVWNAAFQSLAQAANLMGIPCNEKAEAYTAAETLDRISPNPETDYGSVILLAGIYPKSAATHHNPTQWQWEPEEYIEYLEDHRIMVKALESLTKEKSARQTLTE